MTNVLEDDNETDGERNNKDDKYFLGCREGWNENRCEGISSFFPYTTHSITMLDSAGAVGLVTAIMGVFTLVTMLIFNLPDGIFKSTTVPKRYPNTEHLVHFLPVITRTVVSQVSAVLPWVG